MNDAIEMTIIPLGVAGLFALLAEIALPAKLKRPVIIVITVAAIVAVILLNQNTVGDEHVESFPSTLESTATATSSLTPTSQTLSPAVSVTPESSPAVASPEPPASGRPNTSQQPSSHANTTSSDQSPPIPPPTSAPSPVANDQISPESNINPDNYQIADVKLEMIGAFLCGDAPVGKFVRISWINPHDSQVTGWSVSVVSLSGTGDKAGLIYNPGSDESSADVVLSDTTKYDCTVYSTGQTWRACVAPLVGGNSLENSYSESHRGCSDPFTV